jgi:hypothetical protein
MFRVCKGVANKSFLASVCGFHANNLEGFQQVNEHDTKEFHSRNAICVNLQIQGAKKSVSTC